VALRIADTGRGIPSDQLARIFEPFTQAEGTNPYTRSSGGTGLGLAISRRLARLMGGDITVETQEGHGSVFTLWLPTEERRTAPRLSSSGGRFPTGRISSGTTLADAGTDSADTAPTPATDGNALARIGTALAAETGVVVRAFVARLREDPGIPRAAPAGGSTYTDAELEDHVATFLSDVGLAMRTLGEGGADATALMRDGTAIRAL
jgi:hypothetical protein